MRTIKLALAAVFSAALLCLIGCVGPKSGMPEVTQLSESNKKLPDRSLNSEYQNFELSAFVRTFDGAKGFVYFHTDENLSKGYRVAINNDLNDKAWWRKSGSLFGVRNVVKNFAKDGEWFELNVKVSGALIEVSVDGVKIVEYIQPANPYRLEAAKNMRLSKGRISVVHESGGPIEIMDLKVSGLPARSDVENQQWNAIDETNDPVIRLHQRDYPVLDYHVHLKGGFSPDWALARSRTLGVNYAIAPNCGRDFPLNTAEKALDWLEEAKDWPFLICMQGEGREWYKLHPKNVQDKFDFSFTDAMTFDDPKGNRTHIWKANEVKCAPGEEEEYMDWIVKTICEVVTEPADIYANPLWLPDILRKDYDRYWTKQRKEKVLEAIVKSGKPIEINTILRIPDDEFIKMAKARGVKFTLGTNNINPEFTPFGETDVKPEYGNFAKVLRVIDEFGLKPDDFYKPRLRSK